MNGPQTIQMARIGREEPIGRLFIEKAIITGFMSRGTFRLGRRVSIGIGVDEIRPEKNG